MAFNDVGNDDAMTCTHLPQYWPFVWRIKDKLICFPLKCWRGEFPLSPSSREFYKGMLTKRDIPFKINAECRLHNKTHYWDCRHCKICASVSVEGQMPWFATHSNIRISGQVSQQLDVFLFISFSNVRTCHNLIRKLWVRLQFGNEHRLSLSGWYRTAVDLFLELNNCTYSWYISRQE